MSAGTAVVSVSSPRLRLWPASLNCRTSFAAVCLLVDRSVTRASPKNTNKESTYDNITFISRPTTCIRDTYNHVVFCHLIHSRARLPRFKFMPEPARFRTWPMAQPPAARGCLWESTYLTMINTRSVVFGITLPERARGVVRSACTAPARS